MCMSEWRPHDTHVHVQDVDTGSSSTYAHKALQTLTLVH